MSQARGFARTQNDTKKTATPRNSVGVTKHADPNGASNGSAANGARKTSPSPNPQQARAGTGAGGNQQQQQQSSKSPSANQQNQPMGRNDTSMSRFSARSYSGGGSKQRITPRLEAHMERMQQALNMENEVSNRVRAHRTEVMTRAIENEMNQKEYTKSVIEQHNRMSFEVQQQNERERRDRMNTTHELEERARMSVEMAKKNRNEWANRVAREQDQTMDEKIKLHSKHIMSVKEKTLESNRARRQRLEERKAWQAAEAEQREIEKKRQEEERAAAVQQVTNAHRDKFLADKRAHHERVLAAQRRNEDQIKERLREEEEHIAQKDEARRHAIAMRNEEIRQRQAAKYEKHQEIKRNVHKADERRKDWEADVNAHYEENCWIAAQTKAFNATHRKKYVPFCAGSSRSASNMH